MDYFKEKHFQNTYRYDRFKKKKQDIDNFINDTW